MFDNWFFAQALDVLRELDFGGSSGNDFSFRPIVEEGVFRPQP